MQKNHLKTKQNTIPTSFGKRNWHSKAQQAICSPLMLLFNNDKLNRCGTICVSVTLNVYNAELLSKSDFRLWKKHTFMYRTLNYRCLRWSLPFHSHDSKYLVFTTMHVFMCFYIYTISEAFPTLPICYVKYFLFSLFQSCMHWG